jgi:hypothetical protein
MDINDCPDDECAMRVLQQKHRKSAPVAIHPSFYTQEQDDADAQATDAESNDNGDYGDD